MKDILQLIIANGFIYFYQNPYDLHWKPENIKTWWVVVNYYRSELLLDSRRTPGRPILAGILANLQIFVEPLISR